MLDVVYFSSVTDTTHRFVEKLEVTAHRIPLRRTDDPLYVTEPYVLIVPTYGAGNGKGAVPKQVIRFLNVPENRAVIEGVVATGNRNFGSTYGLAGRIVAQKCGVPLLYELEMMGTPEDVDAVSQIVKTHRLLDNHRTEHTVRP